MARKKVSSLLDDLLRKSKQAKDQIEEDELEKDIDEDEEIEYEDEYQEDYDEEEVEKSEEEYDEEIEKSEEDLDEEYEDYDEDEEVEKSEDELEEDDLEKSEDEDDDYLELEEVVSLVMEKIKPSIDERLAEVEENVEKIANILEDRTDIENRVEEAQTNPDEEIEKSMKEINKKLDTLLNKQQRIRKSVGSKRDLNVGERYGSGDKQSVDSLSKSKKAERLQGLIEMGNKRISTNDVMLAETKGVLTDAARQELEKTFR